MTDLAPPPIARPARFTRALPGLGLRIGAILALLLLLVGFASIIWTPYPVETLDTLSQLQDPGSAHLLGTDQLGRDVLSLLMKGILTSFIVSAVALAIGLFAGIPLGIAATLFGRWGDRLILCATEFITGLSAFVIAVLLTATTGPGAINAMLAIGIFNIAVVARITRDILVPYRGLDHIAASRLAGFGGWDLARLHVLPHVTGLLLAAALTQLAFGVLLEAGLSYVGPGSQLPGSSLGLMLKDAQGYIAFKPLLAIVPGVALLLIATSINLCAASLRTRFGAKHAA